MGGRGKCVGKGVWWDIKYIIFCSYKNFKSIVKCVEGQGEREKVGFAVRGIRVDGILFIFYFIYLK